MEKIQFIGADLLNDEERGIFERLSAEIYERISRMLDDASITVHLKEYKDCKDRKNCDEKKRKKYATLIRVISKDGKFESSDYDWDIAKVMHKVSNALVNEIKHKLRIWTITYSEDIKES